MGDDDFMAALRKAFQESEQQRASKEGPAEEEEAGSAPAAPADTGEEPREE